MKHGRGGIPFSRRGFALITTLVVLTLLAVIVAAFLAGAVSERQTARAFGNAARAEQAAQAAVSEGIALLKAQFQAHPDSATTWEAVLDADSHALTEGTVFYYREHPGGSFEPGDPLYFQPLISGAAAQPAGQAAAWALAESGKAFADPDNSVDLNRARFAGDTFGWIGSPQAGGRRSFRAPWVEMKDDSTSDPAKAKVIARYAFWIEDESFKLNVNLAGNAPRGSRSPGQSPTEIPLQGFLQAAGAAEDAGGKAAAAILDLRQLFPGHRFLEFRALNRVDALPGLAEAAKFEGTIFSGALNLSRSGAKRLNLNAVVHDSTEPGEVRKQLDEILAPIRLQLPRFGQRFYRLDPGQRNDAQVSGEHAEIYLQKIAANLRDYIDTDSQPTVVNNDPGRTIRLGAKAERAIEPLESGTLGNNSVLAVGKENVPYFQEFACRVNLKKFEPPTTKDGVDHAEYEFYLDYYFEFWNMTARDIRGSDLGPHPFLKVYDQAGFDTGDGGTLIPPGRPFEIPIPENLVFPAGRATVLTTDPEPPERLVPASVHPVILPVADSARHYTGITKKVTSGGFRVDLQARSSTGPNDLPATDYETKMVFGNDLGILESLCTLPLARGGASSDNALSLHNDWSGIDAIAGSGDGLYFIRGGSLRGSPGPSQYGDPRTNNEQLFLRVYVPRIMGEAEDADQTRYFNSGLDNPGTESDPDHPGKKIVEIQVPANSSLGASNSLFVNASVGKFANPWPDSFEWNPAGIDSVMVLANGPLRSIGELGHLFDPARGLRLSGDIRYSRGGGRTFAIGQPDPLWDKDSGSASREWAAWRLTDLFCTTDETRLEGRLNLNGVRRDGGAALKAALYGYRFSSGADADPHLSEKELSPAAMDALVQQILDRLDHQTAAFAKTQGPFAERGELSELPLFQNGDALAGTAMDKVYDRGREELFRRLVELTTTRGSVFSAYAVGQAISQDATGRKTAVATARTKVTFELVPYWETPPSATFDPADADAVQARFKPPDAYRVKILQVSN